MDSNVKLSNVIGAPFSDYVLLQLYIRAARNSSTNRTNEDVLFLANKTAWARLVSSVDIQIVEEQGAQDFTSYYGQFNLNNSSLDYSDTNSLAKNWVLEAGTSIQKGNGITLRKGIGPDGAYGLGGTEELGYRPLPGLTSVQIETTGRLGSLKQATVNFKVWNMNQLNVMEALYFRLGYSMLLEWGHTQYFDNKGVFQPTDIYGINDPFAAGQRKESIQQAIALKARNSFGNYDGMLGMVANFNWSMNQDGGFDCSVKLIGLGAVMDSMRINQAYKLPKGLNQEFKKNVDALRRQQAADLFKKSYDEWKKNNPDPPAATSAPGLPYPTLPFASMWDLFTKGEIPWGGLENENQWQTYATANRIFQAVSPNQLGYNYADIKPAGYDVVSLYAPFTSPPKGSETHVLANFRGVYWQLPGQFSKVKTGAQVVVNYTLLNDAAQKADIDNTYNNNTLQDDPLTQAIINANGVSSVGNTDSTKFTIPYGANTITQLYDLGARYYYSPGAGTGNFSTKAFLPITNYPDNKAVDAAITYSPATPPIVSLPALYEYNGRSIPWNVDFNLKSFVYEGGANLNYRKNVTRQTVIDNLDRIITNNPTATWTIKSVSKDKIEATLLANGPIGTLNDNLMSADAATKGAAITGNKPDGNGQPVEGTDGTQRYINVLWTLTTNNPGFFTNVVLPPPPPEEKKPEPPKPADFEQQANEATVNQTDSAEGFASALQAMLTVIQLKAKVALGQQSKKYLVLSTIDATKKFFEDGVLNGVLDSNNIPKALPAGNLSKSGFNLLQYASKGFNSDLMVDPTLYNRIKSVNFEDLCKVVAIGYKQGDEEGFGITQFAPTYITFGYLLAFLNNMCLIYDSPESKIPTNNSSTAGTAKRPYIYIDFNPETNFCLTTPQQFSIDPLTCLVPMNATDDQYKSIYPVNIVGQLKDLFQPQGTDAEKDPLNQVSLLLNQNNLGFQTAENSNQGRLMNILLNIDYLLNLIKGFAGSDPENAVKLEPFLNQIVSDINKSMGNINSLRVAYRDESNVVQILDDQWVPSIADQPSVLSASEYNSKLQKLDEVKLAGLLPLSGTPKELPVAGNLSLARQFQIKTVMSTKLASMIAISAQAATGSVNAKDHSSLSYLNAHFQDRYKPYVQDATNGDAGANTDTTAKAQTEDNDFKVANKFNEHVINIFYNLNITPENISLAKNYYIERMSKVKSEDTNIYAAPFIPAEVEMTLDGISGIIMGNAFTVPQDRLPLSLRGENGLAKIAFIVTGLSHTVQNNEWLTKIKGQMIKLRENSKTVKSSTIIGQIKDQFQYEKQAKNSRMVPTGESVNTQNFSTTYYPGYVFNKATSDIKLANKNLSPLTESDIKDDTTQNPFNQGKLNSPVPFFVIHHTNGNPTADGVYSTFKERGFPAQYVIDRAGRIYRFLPDGALGYHAGNYNNKAQGVEISAKNDSDVLPIQIEAAARLAQYLGYSKNQIVGHGQIAAKGHKEPDEGKAVVDYINNYL